MDKNEKKAYDAYEGKITIEERLMLLFAGIFCFPVGFALYFYFDGKKNHECHVHFVRVGAWTGFVITITLLIASLVFCLAGYLQF